MRARISISLSFCLLILFSAHVAAQTSTHDRWRQLKNDNSQRDEQVMKRWQRELEKIDELIRKDRSTKALKRGDRLASDMLTLIQSGEGMGPWLGTTNMLRALAATQSGDQRLGLWHWHIALQMFPELAERDLESFGEAGEFLRSHPPRRGPLDLPAQGGPVLPFAAEGVTRPKKKYTPNPQFPPGKFGMDEPVHVIVQTIIDKTGKVRDPLILKSDGEFTLVCAALEAMWKWEFAPAKKDGEPVDVFYNLTINFRSQR